MAGFPYERYENLRLELDGRGVLTVTIHNPERRNAVTRPMHYELESVWADADYDDDIRVIVITGAGAAFCAGVDLTALADPESAARRGRPDTKLARRLFYEMLDCEKPIVAKVRGPAYGMGLNIALGADIVIAAETAVFCDSHVKAAIAPGDGGVVNLPLLIGFHRAKEYLMLGDPIPAPLAATWGLINHAVPDAELDARVDALVGRLCEGAPLALSYAKLAVNTLIKQVGAGAFETSVALDMLTLRSEDVQEGTAAFIAKRRPRFRGR